jgi:hypothetical protein
MQPLAITGPEPIAAISRSAVEIPSVAFIRHPFQSFDHCNYLLPSPNPSQAADQPNHQQDDENQAEHSAKSIVAIAPIAKAAAAQQQKNQNNYKKRAHLLPSMFLEGAANSPVGSGEIRICAPHSNAPRSNSFAQVLSDELSRVALFDMAGGVAFTR